jgi:hypothetical protein
MEYDCKLAIQQSNQEKFEINLFGLCMWGATTTTTTEGEKKEGGISEKKAPIDDLLIADVCFLQYICKRLHNKIRPL